VVLAAVASYFYYYSFSQTLYRAMDKSAIEHKPLLMKHVTPFEWDYMYIFGPLTGTDNIDYITKSHYNGFPLFDDTLLLMFVKENKIITYIRHDGGGDGYIYIADKSLTTQLVGQVCVSYHVFTPNNAIFSVSKLAANQYSIIQK